MTAVHHMHGAGHTNMAEMCSWKKAPRRMAPPPSLRGPAAGGAVLLLLLCAALWLGLAACQKGGGESNRAAPPPPPELVFCNWAEDVPAAILQDFTRETGVPVRYQPFNLMEDAVRDIRAGQRCDVAVFENQYLPELIAGGHLMAIDFADIPNFRNIGPEFRDLAVDPGNAHAVPYHYGTTGLVVRTDLVKRLPRRWSDLWDPGCAARVAVRDDVRELIGMTLLSLGFPLDSEDPAQVDAAAKRLRALAPRMVRVPVEAEGAVARLLEGTAAVLVGWSEDYRVARERGAAVMYVIPAEGTGIWADSFTIPASTADRRTAARLIDYLLRPEVGARLVNEKGYANANAAAKRLIRPEILGDAVVHPPAEFLRKSAFWKPLSPAGNDLYEREARSILALLPGAETPR